MFLHLLWGLLFTFQELSRCAFFLSKNAFLSQMPNAPQSIKAQKHSNYYSTCAAVTFELHNTVMPYVTNENIPENN